MRAAALGRGAGRSAEVGALWPPGGARASGSQPPSWLALPPTRRPTPTPPRSYEIMSPETIGLSRADEAGIVLGKHSGR